MIEVAVRPLGGDNFEIRLDATERSVGEAKAEIARVQGTDESRQELHKVAVRTNGGAVREDDAKAEPLDDDDALLGDGEVVAMAVKELPPFVWRAVATVSSSVVLSHYGAVATQIREEVKQRISSNVNQEGEIVVETEEMVRWSLTAAGKELIEGKHYWEVELRCTGIRSIGAHGHQHARTCCCGLRHGE
jgi:hypothetical protein